MNERKNVEKEEVKTRMEKRKKDWMKEKRNLLHKINSRKKKKR